MTPHADTVGATAQHRVNWVVDAVIAMAHDASGKISRVEGFLVRTFFIHLGLERVAVGTNILNPVYTRRCGAVVAVTRCTGGSAQITSHRQRFVVHARAVLCELIRRNVVSLHVSCVSMAASARVRHVHRVYRGAGIAGRPEDRERYDNLYTLPLWYLQPRGACRAHWCGTGPAVRPQAGVVLPHICRIRMATSAQLWDVLAVNLALPPGLSAHRLGWIIAGRVTSVAAGASQTLLRVDVLAECLLAYSQGLRQDGVTIQAGIRGLPITQACREHNAASQHDIAGHSMVGAYFARWP